MGANQNRWVAVGLVAALGVGCGDVSNESTDKDDLTSVTARERLLAFDSYLYLAADAGEDDVIDAVRKQLRSAIGAFHHANISSGNAELSQAAQQVQAGAVGSAGFAKFDELSKAHTKELTKERVSVVNPSANTKHDVLRVHYRYEDRVIVPRTLTRASIALGLLHPDYDTRAAQVLAECTNPEDEPGLGTIWYDFNPSSPDCQKTMATEQARIDKARNALNNPKTEIVPEEYSRTYIPVTASLKPVKKAPTKYPEYDRLWSGGVEAGALVIGLVNGVIDHTSGSDPTSESGYREALGELQEILFARPGMQLVTDDKHADLTSFKVGSATIKNVTLRDLVRWELDRKGFPENASSFEEQSALRQAVFTKLYENWIRLEENVSVQIGSKPAKATKLVVQFFYGAGARPDPHRRAIRTSDIFIYSGHSYVGGGPLDAPQYKASDFPKSYQLFFIDGCVSFNYYNQEYFDFKADGSKSLDTITNGLETYADGAGRALGRFVAALVSGENPSYESLVSTAGTTGTPYSWGKDALRVVDGELDNVYEPSRTPITVTGAK